MADLTTVYGTYKLTRSAVLVSHSLRSGQILFSRFGRPTEEHAASARVPRQEVVITPSHQGDPPESCAHSVLVILARRTHSRQCGLSLRCDGSRFVARRSFYNVPLTRARRALGRGCNSCSVSPSVCPICCDAITLKPTRRCVRSQMKCARCAQIIAQYALR